MTLDEFKERLAEGGNPKILSKLLGQLEQADRPEAGRLFGQYKAVYEKPEQAEPTEVKRGGSSCFWSNGTHTVFAHNNELSVLYPSGSILVSESGQISIIPNNRE